MDSTTGETTPDAASTASDHQHALEELLSPLPDLAPEGSQVQITQLRETTCLRPEDEAPQTETSWVGVVSGAVPSGAAGYQSQLVQQLEDAGFEVRNTVAGPTDGGSGQNGDLTTTYTRRCELSAVVTHSLSGGTDQVELLAKSPCQPHPEDHQMLRSELDPEYGLSSSLYPDGR